MALSLLRLWFVPSTSDTGGTPRRRRERMESVVPSPSAADAALVSSVRTGDPAALERIFRMHGERLLRFAAQHLHSMDAAEDVVQDVFLSIWRMRERWQVRTSLTTYLFQSVRHRVANRLHQRMGEDPQGDAVVISDDFAHGTSMPDRELEDAELRLAVARAVASLSPRAREVFQLSRDHGLTYREIAATLGISVKTVELHIGRALAALRLALASWA